VNCAKILAAAGITEVRYRHDYKNDPLVAEMFGQAGVLVTRLER
jgi:dCMP deaminase